MSTPNLLTVQTSVPLPAADASVIVVELAGELDVYSAPQLRDVLAEAAARSAPLIVVDLAALEFMDSSGLGVLVAGWKRARAQGGRLSVAAPSARVARIFRTTGLDRALPVFATVAAAEAGLCD